MPKFRKKPIVIEAVQWTGKNTDELDGFCGGSVSYKLMSPLIPTLKSVHDDYGLMVGIGDWIIKGVKGEFYPVKNDIFRETYEPI